MGTAMLGSSRGQVRSGTKKGARVLRVTQQVHSGVWTKAGRLAPGLIVKSELCHLCPGSVKREHPAWPDSIPLNSVGAGHLGSSWAPFGLRQGSSTGKSGA